MSLRLVIGGSGSGKSTLLQEEMIERSIADYKGSEQQEENGNAADASGGFGKYIFIVPDQFTMQVQKDIVCMHPNKGIMNIDVLSFGRLYYRILDEVGQPGASEKILLDDTGKNLILRHLAQELEDDLPVIGSSMKKTGYVHEVKSTISEFMQYGLSPKDVEKLIEFSSGKNALKGKLADVNKLYQAFLQYLGDRFLTTEETMDQLAEALPKSKQLRGSVVVLDGFTGFTPVQNRVIRELLNLCKEVVVAITKDGDSELFTLTDKTIKSLEKMAEEEHVICEDDRILMQKPVPRLKDNKELAFLEENLFRMNQRTYDSKKAASVREGKAMEAEDYADAGRHENPQDTCNGIHMCVADTPREEMRKVCLEIRRLVKEQEYAYREIAIVTGDLEHYAVYGDEMFARYDIPAFIDNNRRLIMNPFTEYLKGALQVIRKDFSYDSVMQFLKCGFTGISLEDIDLLDNYIKALGIRGQKKWNRKFVRYPRYMNKDLDKLEKIDSIRKNVMEILQPILEMNKMTDPVKMTEAVYHLLADNNMFERLKEQELLFEQQGDYARKKEYSQIYEYVMKLLEQIASLLQGETISLDEYIKIVEAGITELSIGVLPQGVDHILLGDIERSRLANIKALFFVGINDGIIPKSGGNGGIISDIDREFLIEGGYELAPSPRQKMYIQKLYLYMNMTKPTHHLFLSYARMDGEGKSLRPAYLIGMIRRMYPEKKLENFNEKFNAGDFSDRKIFAQVVGEKDGLEYLADYLRDFAADLLPEEQKDNFYALYYALTHLTREQNGEKGAETMESDMSSPDAQTLDGISCRERAVQMMENAFYKYQSKRLGKELSKQLYGEILVNSISKLEQYAECAYAHFLQYAMKLSPQEKFEFSAMDKGNIFHDVIRAFGEKLKERKLTWTTFSEEEGEEILKEVVETVALGYRENVLYQDFRTMYEIKRMTRILGRTIMNLQYQFRKGEFVNKANELEFRERLLPSDDSVFMRGRIDRIDICEEADRCYVEVVDYKSSQRKIDLQKLYYGTQIQLPIYLDQAMRILQEEMKKAGKKDCRIIPAAMFYYALVDPIRPKESNRENAEKDLENWRHKELRLNGYFQENEAVTNRLDRESQNDTTRESNKYSSDVVHMEKNKDGSFAAKGNQSLSSEDMRLLMEYANYMASLIGKEMIEGNKEIHPCSKDSCKYCDYKEICGFDTRLRGFGYRMDQTLEKGKELEAMRKVLHPENHNQPTV